LEEDDEALGPDEYFSSDTYEETGGGESDNDGREYGEGSALLTQERRSVNEKKGLLEKVVHLALPCYCSNPLLEQEFFFCPELFSTEACCSAT